MKHGPPGRAYDKAQYLAGWMLLFLCVVLSVIKPLRIHEEDEEERSCELHQEADDDEVDEHHEDEAKVQLRKRQ